MDQKKYKEALELYQQCTRHFNETLGEDHLLSLKFTFNMGIANYELGEVDDGSDQMWFVINCYKDIFGEEHMETVKKMNILKALSRKPRRRTVNADTNGDGTSYSVSRQRSCVVM